MNILFYQRTSDMCVSFAPAKFDGTILYMGEINHSQKGLVHVMGYQNEVKNYSDTPNAMILHFPARKIMGPKNILETSECLDILANMKQTLEIPLIQTMGLSTGTFQSFQMFESGIYTIILAANAKVIPEALKEVPKHKRPLLNFELFDFYAEAYPGWSIALCCFNNKDTKNAAPILWWYEPLNESEFLLPAIDCHTGDIPSQKKVMTNHWVILGSDEKTGKKVSYSLDQGDIPLEVEMFLPTHIVGRRFERFLPNGDFVISKEEVETGKLNFQRRFGA